MHKFFALGMLGSLLVAAVNADTNKLSFKLETDLIGPYEKFQKDVTLRVWYTANLKASNISEELRLSNPTTGEQYSKSSTKNHEVLARKTFTTFDLNLDRWFDEDGLRIVFSMLQNGVVIQSWSADIYPIERETIYVTKDNIRNLRSKSLAFKITSNRKTAYSDNFGFSEFNNYIDADNYYSLDLKSNYFVYAYEEMDYKEATLCLVDKNCQFKYLTHQGNKIVIPLNVIDDEGDILFTFKNKYFVNPLNLETADYKIPNFVETNKIYFPVNKKKEFLGTEIQIILKECGFNKYTLYFDLTYDVFTNLIGACHSSDYCVKGEVH